MQNMEKKNKRFGQYIFDNHNFEGSVDDFFNETAAAEGSIVHCFNHLDSELNSSICQLVNDRTDEPGAIIIYKQPFSAKVDLFYRLVRSMEICCEG